MFDSTRKEELLSQPTGEKKTGVTRCPAFECSTLRMKIKKLIKINGKVYLHEFSLLLNTIAWQKLGIGDGEDYSFCMDLLWLNKETKATTKSEFSTHSERVISDFQKNKHSRIQKADPNNESSK